MAMGSTAATTRRPGAGGALCGEAGGVLETSLLVQSGEAATPHRQRKGTCPDALAYDEGRRENGGDVQRLTAGAFPLAHRMKARALRRVAEPQWAENPAVRPTRSTTSASVSSASIDSTDDRLCFIHSVETRFNALWRVFLDTVRLDARPFRIRDGTMTQPIPPRPVLRSSFSCHSSHISLVFRCGDRHHQPEGAGGRRRPGPGTALGA